MVRLACGARSIWSRGTAKQVGGYTRCFAEKQLSGILTRPVSEETCKSKPQQAEKRNFPTTSLKGDKAFGTQGTTVIEGPLEAIYCSLDRTHVIQQSNNELACLHHYFILHQLV